MTRIRDCRIYPHGSLLHVTRFDRFRQVQSRPISFSGGKAFFFRIFDYYCHVHCFHFKSPLSNSVHTVHYCACCLHTGASRISRSFYLSCEHRNVDSCQTDPTKEGAVYYLSLFDKGSYLHELMGTVQNTLPAQQRRWTIIVLLIHKDI
jgi:hypothetical protein